MANVKQCDGCKRILEGIEKDTLTDKPAKFPFSAGSGQREIAYLNISCEGKDLCYRCIKSIVTTGKPYENVEPAPFNTRSVVAGIMEEPT